LLETLTRNAIQHPGEEKYRKIRTTNEKLRVLFGTEGIIAIMQEMGWQIDGEFMVLPKNVTLDFPRHVVKILDAKSYIAKQKESAKKFAKMADNPAKAGMMKELENDRRERAAAAALRSQAPAATAVPAAAEIRNTATVAAPSPQVDPNSMTEEQQLQAALKLSMQDSGVAPQTPAPVSTTSAKAPSKPKSAFDFEKRTDVADKAKKEEISLAEIRKQQKEKYKEFQNDPNAKKAEAYQRPASVANGAKQEQVSLSFK